MKIYLVDGINKAYMEAEKAADAACDSIDLDDRDAFKDGVVYRAADCFGNSVISPDAEDICEFAAESTSPINIERFTIVD